MDDEVSSAGGAVGRGAVRGSLEEPGRYGLRQWSGWIVGPGLLALTLLTSPPDGLSVDGWRTVGLAGLMATFWIAESVPIPVTALLPLVLLPALGLGGIGDAAAPFANPVIFLFLGGFLIALAMQRWGLHRRLAIGLIARIGTSPRRIVGGFLLAAAAISMWVSNTATALMMLPIGISVVQLVPESGRAAAGARTFAAALMLAIAYGATTGGLATIIGTPPNALLAAFVQDIYGVEIGFGQWMCVGVPLAVLFLPLIYLVLTRWVFRLEAGPLAGMAELMVAERARLGRPSRGEVAVAVVFGLTALGWIFQPWLKEVIPMISDTTIAMAGAIVLFAIPVNVRQGEFVMDWEAARGVPWDVLLLFGGGLSLAGAIQTHGVADFLGGLASALPSIPVMIVVAVICFGILMLTELTSNTATAATFLPVVAAIAVSLGQNPLLFLIPAALAASGSYMMPVGTPPNAIVFGSGLVRLPQMAQAGLVINFLAVPILVAAVWLLGGVVFGIELGVVPAWAR